MVVDLYFLSVYKRHVIRNCLWFLESDDYYIFNKDGKVFYLDKKNNLLLKKIWHKNIIGESSYYHFGERSNGKTGGIYEPSRKD